MMEPIKLTKEQKEDLINKYHDKGFCSDERLTKADGAIGLIVAMHYGERLVWSFFAEELGFDTKETNKMINMVIDEQEKEFWNEQES